MSSKSNGLLHLTLTSHGHAHGPTVTQLSLHHSTHVDALQHTSGSALWHTSYLWAVTRRSPLLDRAQRARLLYSFSPVKASRTPRLASCSHAIPIVRRRCHSSVAAPRAASCGSDALTSHLAAPRSPPTSDPASPGRISAARIRGHKYRPLPAARDAHSISILFTAASLGHRAFGVGASYVLAAPAEVGE